MLLYHGTNTAAATQIAAGNVNVSLGGGEFGQGFYTGEHLWAAKSWAFNKSQDRSKNVVIFDVPDASVTVLNIRIIDRRTASFCRINIRRRNATRTHQFGVDMVWGPVVGNDSIRCEQHKWESTASQILLNGVLCGRTLI